MPDPAATMSLFTHGIDQPDPWGMYNKAQNVLIQGQTLETNRRILDGQKAAGAAVQAATKPDGSLDPEVGYSYIQQNVPPDQQPAAMAAFQAIESTAIVNRTNAAKSAQEQIGYAGQAGASFLALHPGPVSPSDGSGFVTGLVHKGAISPTVGLALTRALAGATDDVDRRRIIAEWWLTQLGPDGQSAQITVNKKVVDPKTGQEKLVPGVIPAVKILAGQVATPKEMPIPAPHPVEAAEAAAASAPVPTDGGPPAPAPAAPAAPGSVPATDDTAPDDSGFAATGPSASEAMTASGATGVDIAHRDQAIAAAYQAKKEAGTISTLLSEAAHVRTGPYAHDITRLQAAWNELLPGVPWDISGGGTMEAFIKTATALAQQAGADGTDMNRGLSLASNLNENISNVGIEMIGHQLLGLKAMAVAEGRLAGAYAQDPAALRKNNDGWIAHGDPRLFQAQMMSATERDQFLGARYVPANKRGPDAPHWVPVTDAVTGRAIPLTRDKLLNLNKFETDHQYAADNHWFDDIPELKSQYPVRTQ